MPFIIINLILFPILHLFEAILSIFVVILGLSLVVLVQFWFSFFFFFAALLSFFFTNISFCSLLCVCVCVFVWDIIWWWFQGQQLFGPRSLWPIGPFNNLSMIVICLFSVSIDKKKEKSLRFLFQQNKYFLNQWWL